MKSLLFLVIILFASLPVVAQTNFTDAVLFTTNGDSLKGKIDYRNWKNNPQSISFRDENGTETNYNAATIHGFRITPTGEVYRSFEVAMDKRPGTANDALKSAARDTARIKQHVFLLELIEHPLLSLYQYVNGNRENFFYRKERPNVTELVNYFLYDEVSSQVKPYEPFKTQLGELFSDCSGKYIKTYQVRFRRSDFERVFSEYILCKDPGTQIAARKADPVTVKFGIIAGGALTFFNIKGDNEELADDGYKSGFSPVFGGSVDIGLPRNMSSWHIINELVYKSYKTGTSFTRPYNVTYTVNRTIDFSFSYIQLNSLLRYVFNTGSSVKPYINAGISNAFIIAENKNSSHNIFSFGTEETVTAMDNPRKYELAIQAGAGVQIKNCSAEFRFSGNNKGFSSQHALNTHPSGFMFLLGYQF